MIFDSFLYSDILSERTDERQKKKKKKRQEFQERKQREKSEDGLNGTWRWSWSKMKNGLYLVSKDKIPMKRLFGIDRLSHDNHDSQWRNDNEDEDDDHDDDDSDFWTTCTADP